MRLSIVIPVWNDAEGLARLLGQLQAMAGLVPQLAEVIVVDDASDPPARDTVPAELLQPWAGVALNWLRLEEQGGAGRARNEGAAAVTGSHVLFFDSDDLLAPGFPVLLAGLEGAAFDFAMFRHADSRRMSEGVEAPLEPDASIWEAVVPRLERTGEWGVADLPARQRLCRVVAYPWNKIYEMGFLRRAGLRCTEIPVHNDLELHWSGFIAADRVLVSPRIGCTHVVLPAARHLTNRRDAGRLRVFEALAAVAARMRATPGGSAYAEGFAEFCLRLIDWAGGRLESPAARALFEARAAGFLQGALGPQLLGLALMRNPALAEPLRRRLRRAG